MSSDGPTLADESYAAARAGGRRPRPRARPHPPPRRRPEHTHPLTAGQEAHARGRLPRARRTTTRHDDDGRTPGPGAGHDFALPDLPAAVDVFDTTLRDGSQQEGLSLTVDDKLRVAEQLDHLGVTFIEGGWPGANPKDAEFFARAPKELHLARATLVAFGSTRRAGVRAEDDETLRHLVEAQTEAVCIVAKSSEMHVVDALRTTLDEAVAMVADSVAFLRANDLRVFLDAEHFFDGYKANPEFTLRILQAAEEAGAETLVLCDTNGGTLPHEVRAHRDHRARPVRDPGRRALPQRQRLRGGQLAGRRDGRGHPRAGLRERLRRAGRQRRPGRRRARPVAQAAGVDHPGGPASAPDPGGAPHRRAGQHRPRPAAAVRRRLGVRPQGRPAHVGHRPPLGRLRAHLARPGRQRHPLRRVGDGRPLDPGHEGRGAGAGARLRRHDLGARLAEAARVRGLPLRGGRRLPRAAAPPAPRAGARRSSSSSPTGSSPTRATSCPPRRP